MKKNRIIILAVILLAVGFYFFPKLSLHRVEKEYNQAISTFEELSPEELVSQILESEKFVLYIDNETVKASKTLTENLKKYKDIAESNGFKFYYNEFPKSFKGNQEHYYKDVLKVHSLPAIVIRTKGNFTEIAGPIVELEPTVEVFEKTIEELEREPLYK